MKEVDIDVSEFSEEQKRVKAQYYQEQYALIERAEKAEAEAGRWAKRVKELEYRLFQISQLVNGTT